MALIKCKECGNQISDSAKSCPHCGATVKSTTVKSKSGCLTKFFKIVIYIILALLAFSLIGYLFGPTDTKPKDNQRSMQKKKENPIIVPQKEVPVALNTDVILTQHIEILKAGSKLSRQIWVLNDPTEMQKLLNEKEKLKSNNLGDFSQINDAMFFQKTYIDAYTKCISIAEQISQSDNESEIDSLITDALVYQTLAWDAFLYIQDEDLDYPRDNINVLSNTYKPLSAIFGDARLLKLPIADFKIAVINALPNLQQAKTELNGL